jgi:hypothetical protein
MGQGRAEDAPEDGESPKERADRELIELLNELRVSLPGVQVLFAFLLTVPFSSRFGQLTAGQRSVYFATFLATAGASAFLMAPTSYHRILFRVVDKEKMVRTANRFAIAGTALLSLAIGGAVLVVADVLYASAVAGWTAGAVVFVEAWLWFGLPLWRRAQGG